MLTRPLFHIGARSFAWLDARADVTFVLLLWALRYPLLYILWLVQTQLASWLSIHE